LISDKSYAYESHLMQKYQSWFNSDDDQDLNMFLRETRKGLMGAGHQRRYT